MQGPFVKSVFRQKNQVEKRRTDFRRTRMRYVALILACLVVFGCEYCFDTPSVHTRVIHRLYKQKYKQTTSTRADNN